MFFLPPALGVFVKCEVQMTELSPTSRHIVCFSWAHLSISPLCPLSTPFCPPRKTPLLSSVNLLPAPMVKSSFFSDHHNRKSGLLPLRRGTMTVDRMALTVLPGLPSNTVFGFCGVFCLFVWIFWWAAKQGLLSDGKVIVQSSQEGGDQRGLPFFFFFIKYSWHVNNLGAGGTGHPHRWKSLCNLGLPKNLTTDSWPVTGSRMDHTHGCYMHYILCSYNKVRYTEKRY